jgi:hypothetical protein
MWSMHEPILHNVWNLLVYEIITFYAFSSLFYLTQFNGPYQISDLVINFCLGDQIMILIPLVKKNSKHYAHLHSGGFRNFF